MATLKQSLNSHLVQKKKKARNFILTCLLVHQGFHSAWRQGVARDMFLFWQGMVSFTGRSFPAWWPSNTSLCFWRSWATQQLRFSWSLGKAPVAAVCIFFCCNFQKLALATLLWSVPSSIINFWELTLSEIHLYLQGLTPLFYRLAYVKSRGNPLNKYRRAFVLVKSGLREPKPENTKYEGFVDRTYQAKEWLKSWY